MHSSAKRGMSVRRMSVLPANNSRKLSNSLNLSNSRNLPTASAAGIKRHLGFFSHIRTTLPQNSRVLLQDRLNQLGSIYGFQRRAYYIDGHGVCERKPSKFTIPKDKAVIFLAMAGTLLETNYTNRLEQNIKHVNGLNRFMKGNTNYFSNFGARIHLGGEKIFDQYILFTTKQNQNSGIILPQSGERAFPYYLGNASGHVYKLPLHTSHSRTGQVVSNSLNFGKGKHRLSDIISNLYAYLNLTRLPHRPSVIRFQIMLHDFATGGKPDTFVRTNVR